MAKPTHTIYHARGYEVDGKRRTEWTKLGVLFPTPKGAGMAGTLTAFPIDDASSFFRPRPRSRPKKRRRSNRTEQRAGYKSLSGSAGHH